jgi:LDH2 family malate/lactate/ureidoglycolate dehydrogenase
MNQVIRVPHSDLVAWVSRVLELAGVPEAVHRVEAEIMVEADLFGVPSHGVRMLPLTLQGLKEGKAKPNPRVSVLRERAAAKVIDGDNGPGRFVALEGMNSAVELASRCGIGACLALRTTHWGRAHAYAYRAAQRAMIGICTTNAVPNMTAWGSAHPILGNNPLAIGVPASSRSTPVVLDFAMSQAAVGKIGTYLREERRVPHGWGVDEAGNPTDDPARILASRRLLPFGEHKGAGLAIMMELLTGALGGDLLAHEIYDMDRTGLDPGTSKLFIAIDPAAFSAPAEFDRKCRQFEEWVRQTAGPGVAVDFPGDRGARQQIENLRIGVPLHRDIASQLAQLRPPPPWVE